MIHWLNWGFPLLCLAVIIYKVTIGFDRTAAREREYKRLSDKAWLAKVDEWNRPTR